AGLLHSTSAFAQIQLVPVATGLVNPVFVTGARDGTRRLFIVEQAGTIRVMPIDGGAMSLFLDIRSRVRSGGEQGLLGLAFHPSYSSNRRFFVYYTRAADGAIVIAEYAASAANPQAADATERVLLTIPHPSFSNHNGGMVAFGPDGYLYIGVGDGGSANDPPNNAQNRNVLLGKLLRIDVDGQSGSLPYAIPLSNPFFGLIDGRDEIFAYGLRNPWRFAFDRLTNQLWIADVGQGDREEVNTPIQHGGNYGWRVFEGSACTNVDRTLCVPSNYLFPVFEYNHTGGRCSITGGYVYRGSRNSLPAGLYVHGDFCSGEIFTWNGTAQQVVLDTSFSISSFGEDDAGEIYVVALNGVVSRIGGESGGGAACTPNVSPSQVIVSRAGQTAQISVTAPAGCGWTATSTVEWITFPSGATGAGSGTLMVSVAPRSGWLMPRVGLIIVAGSPIVVIQR
ncbi:MAG TPA: PQQ-dependent sugar dehydrogenase, partial [Vicinamibacterales bacterium]|nr:PQQ-dependent sugar dehydrogenase [Vicinamibacterales bacterium]